MPKRDSTSAAPSRRTVLRSMSGLSAMAAFAATCANVPPASAERAGYFALVVGNGAYPNLSARNQLPNPRNDAKAIAEALARLGFRVTTAIDLEKRQLDLAVAEFKAKRIGARVLVLFYAGHGVQIGSRNYMLPSDIMPCPDGEPGDSLVDLQALANDMNDSNAMSLVLLDACRNNPFAECSSGRSSHDGGATASAWAVGQGWARMRNERLIVSFATAPGDVAADAIGQSRHSPYTAALVEHILRPGLEIGEILGLVQSSVKQATDQKQFPEFTRGFGEPLYLRRLQPVPR